MEIDARILRKEEQIALSLRALYDQNGYALYKMNKFEEYDLYMKNKDFLISDGIISFNDTNGKLMALKPDVTLSIVKNSEDAYGRVQKVYYQENVYRVSPTSHRYREWMQTGLECIGDTGEEDIAQVLRLAEESAELISSSYRFQVSHVGFLEAYLADHGISVLYDAVLCRALSEKNTDALQSLCTEAQMQAIIPLLSSYVRVADARAALAPLCRSSASRVALEAFFSLWEKVFEGKADRPAVMDFSLANSTGYYSGIVFKAYVDRIAEPVLSGGQYDGLMKKMGRSSHAIGFAVYLDVLEHRAGTEDGSDFLNIALPKGRLGEKVYEMFERAGFDCASIRDSGRKLIFENTEKKLRYFWVKPSDVSIYVERGSADIGVAGKDILLEYAPDVYELCDLGIGKCRMAVAGKKGFCDDPSRTLRVATKFSNIAQKYYREKCRDIDIIHLNGSIELAPILGLSDVIVDIVETGKTLLENDLEPFETVVPISARLIANKASYQFKKEQIEKVRTGLAEQVKQHD